MKFASIFSKKIFFILSIGLAFFAQTFAADLYYAGTNSVGGNIWCYDADCIESVSQPNPGDTAHIGDGGQLTLSNTIDYNLELSGTAQINILDSATIATGTSVNMGYPASINILGGTLNVQGNINNGGIINVYSGAFDSGGNFNASLTQNVIEGKLNLSGVMTVSSLGVVSVDGDFVVTSTGKLETNTYGTVSVANGGTFSNNGIWINVGANSGAGGLFRTGSFLDIDNIIAVADIGITSNTNALSYGFSGTVGSGLSYNLFMQNNETINYNAVRSLMGPLTWSATGLPLGLNINPISGVISGVPTGAGSGVVYVSATNSGGSIATQQVTYTIVAAPQAASKGRNQIPKQRNR